MYRNRFQSLYADMNHNDSIQQKVKNLKLFTKEQTISNVMKIAIDNIYDLIENKEEYVKMKLLIENIKMKLENMQDTQKISKYRAIKILSDVFKEIEEMEVIIDSFLYDTNKDSLTHTKHLKRIKNANHAKNIHSINSVNNEINLFNYHQQGVSNE